MSNIERYKADLEQLVKRGERIRVNLLLRNPKNREKLSKEQEERLQQMQGNMEKDYQSWYTESYLVIKQLLPDRLEEFEHLYKGDARRREINNSTYHIQDWLTGVLARSSRGFDPDYSRNIAGRRFMTQMLILDSVKVRFDSSLSEIRQLVQADLFDSELDAARELTKQGFLRAAGAVAGVVLEKHLGQVMDNHNIKTSKRNPKISDFNDRLKDESVLDVPSWRQIQRLGDIRNLCDHNKEREPTKEEVDELIGGVEKYTKTLF